MKVQDMTVGKIQQQNLKVQKVNVRVMKGTVN